MDYHLITPIIIIFRLLETSAEFHMTLTLLNKKTSAKNFLLAVFLFALSMGIAQQFVPQTFCWIVIPIIGIPLLSIIFHTNWILSTFAYLLTMGIVAILDTFYSFTLIDLFNFSSFSELMNTNYYYLDMALIFLTIFLFSFIVKFIRKHISVINFIKHNKKSVLINSLIAFVCILSNIFVLILYFDKKTLPLWIILVNIASMTLQLGVSIYNTDNKVKLIRSEKELENHRNYTSKQKTSLANLKRFRHNYKNTLLTITNYAEAGNLERIQHMMPEVNEEVSSLSIDSLDPDLIKNPDLYAIINPKYKESVGKNIPMDFIIKNDIENLDINNYDLTKIIGIFMDNAIYAAANSLTPLVEVTLFERENIAHIKISNTYSGIIPPYEKMFSKGFSTKGTDRGIGLYDVKEILEKYPHTRLRTIHDDNFFNQELMIPTS